MPKKSISTLGVLNPTSGWMGSAVKDKVLNKTKTNLSDLFLKLELTWQACGKCEEFAEQLSKQSLRGWWERRLQEIVQDKNSRVVNAENVANEQSAKVSKERRL